MYKVIKIIVLCFLPNALGYNFIRRSVSREVEDKDPSGTKSKSLAQQIDK